MKQIQKDNITYCEQCGVPLCKTCANHCLICGKDLCDSCYAENNFKCEECISSDKVFETIRRSHLEQYAGCPYSLYLDLILGIPAPMNKNAQLGVIVHEIIDIISTKNINIEEAKAMLENKIIEWNLAEDEDYSIITFDLEEQGKRCLDNYMLIRNELNETFKSEYNIKFSLDDNLPSISCTLDRISKDGDNLHIHDWKTGKPMSGQKLTTDLQVPLYIYAVYKEFGIMPKTFTLHYLNVNKHITYTKLNDNIYEVKTTKNVYTLNIEEILVRTKDILKSIKNQSFNMPSEGIHQWRCKNMCWYGISGTCKGVNDEQWKLLNEKYSSEVA